MTFILTVFVLIIGIFLAVLGSMSANSDKDSDKILGVGFLVGGGVLILINIATLIQMYFHDTAVLMEVMREHNITKISHKYSVSRHLQDNLQKEQ